MDVVAFTPDSLRRDRGAAGRRANVRRRRHHTELPSSSSTRPRPTRSSTATPSADRLRIPDGRRVEIVGVVAMRGAADALDSGRTQPDDLSTTRSRPARRSTRGPARFRMPVLPEPARARSSTRTSSRRATSASWACLRRRQTLSGRHRRRAPAASRVINQEAAERYFGGQRRRRRDHRHRRPTDRDRRRRPVDTASQPRSGAPSPRSISRWRRTSFRA